MPSRRTGHFVQVHRVYGRPELVEVMGRVVSRTVKNDYWLGWHNVSRELPRRKAVKIAKAYRQAGFDSRVVMNNAGPEYEDRELITDKFLRKPERRSQ